MRKSEASTQIYGWSDHLLFYCLSFVYKLTVERQIRNVGLNQIGLWAFVVLFVQVLLLLCFGYYVYFWLLHVVGFDVVEEQLQAGDHVLNSLDLLLHLLHIHFAVLFSEHDK